MSQLKNNSGQNFYPDTKFENVTDASGYTLEQRLQSIGGGGNVPEEKSGTLVAGKVIGSQTVGNHLSFGDDSDSYNYAVYDVVEGEVVTISASCSHAYSNYAFTDKKGIVVKKSASNNSSNVTDYNDVVVPKGATRLYVNAFVSHAATAPKVTTTFNETVMAPYNYLKRENREFTDADKQRYYDLGAQQMDTYNLVKEKVGIIVIGQSNAAGRVPGADFQSSVTVNDKTINLSRSVAKCQIMYGEEDSTAYTQEAAKTFSPFARGESQTWGFDLVLYNEIVNAINLGENEYFYVCKQTRGGTRLRFLSNSTSFSADIDKFKSASSKNSQLYHLKCLVKRALELQPDIKFKAIVMHQGEGDNSSTLMEGEYYMELCQTIQWIRGLVGSPNLPFIFGSIPTNSVSWNETVYNDMVKAAADLNDVYLVTIGEATDWVDDQWHNEDEGLHFGVNTAAKLADDMFNIMVSKKMLAPYV